MPISDYKQLRSNATEEQALSDQEIQKDFLVRTSSKNGFKEWYWLSQAGPRLSIVVLANTLRIAVRYSLQSQVTEQLRKMQSIVSSSDYKEMTESLLYIPNLLRIRIAIQTGP